MQERYLNFWDPKPHGSLLCLPTDGFLTHNLTAVMKRGILAQAAHRYPGIERKLGQKLLNQGRVPGRKGIDIANGNHVTMLWSRPWIASFPIKWVFWERADLWLIERSCIELSSLVDSTRLRGVYLPPIGDGHPYSGVFALMDKYLDGRFIICMERG